MDDFLGVPSSEYVAQNALCFAIRDRFPVTVGHTLVIPRRKVATWFDASVEEQHALMALVAEVKDALDRELRPDGYNIGCNAGPAAGQTVMHLHVHVIPRYHGDMPDPRGGVRHVIPSQGNYHGAGYRRPPGADAAPPADAPPPAAPPPLATGGADDPFWEHLRPLLRGARDIAVVAAFVRDSGLAVLERDLLAALERGARLRLLTGDYLRITQAEALARLLDWQAALAAGDLQVRVVSVDDRPGPPRSFHPKSWRFEGPGSAVAFVGSSNLSRAALCSGVEWNLRVDRAQQPAAYARVVAAFDALWQGAAVLDDAWVRAYERRVRAEPRPARPLPPAADVAPPPAPHALQREALAALRRLRAAPAGEGGDGTRRALVAMATGLGKTWLAVLDVAAFAAERGRWPRVLFLAHQGQLLAQAARAFRSLLHSKENDARVTRFVGAHADLSGDVVLASVQKLSRPEHLARLGPRDFDYVIVDEAHRSAAPSYLRVLARLQPAFLLGLTATPERADQADLGEVFGGEPTYRATLASGIGQGLLAPFAYYGVADAHVEYQRIAYRGARFDEAQLCAAVETEARMAQLWRACQAHPGRRTLVFCVAVQHAEYVSRWLRGQGQRVACVHSGPGADDVEDALARLGRGEVDAVCAVDMLNEGVDLPAIDRVVLLRPTESPVVFLQQLGRGLRRADGKPQLTVLDLVGNHHVFLERLRALLVAAGAPGEDALQALLDGGAPPAALPPGCTIDLELAARRVLSDLLPRTEREAALARFHDQVLLRGERPTAAAFYLLGFWPRALYPGRRGAGWFDFLLEEQRRSGLRLLSAEEQAVLAEPGALPWLRELETTTLVKSFKLVLLRALLEADALWSGLPLGELAARSLRVLRGSPALMKRDLAGVDALLGVDLGGDPPGPAWRSYWNGNPVDAWAGSAWFRREGDRLVSLLPQVAGRAALCALTAELIDFRVADYLSRDLFECEAALEGERPVLRLAGASRRSLPEGEVEVTLAGQPWVFALHKKGCRSARPARGRRDRLADLLRAWFGQDVGRRGRCQVRLTRGEAWTAQALEAQALRLPLPRWLPAYPTLAAVAGALAGRAGQAAEALAVELRPFLTEDEGDDLLAVRARGDSMDGGDAPIQDGEWLLLRPAGGAGPGAFLGKVVLVAVPEGDGDARYLLKRLAPGGDGRGLVLRSDNPAWPPLPLPPEARVVGELADRPARYP